MVVPKEVSPSKKKRDSTSAAGAAPEAATADDASVTIEAEKTTPSTSAKTKAAAEKAKDAPQPVSTKPPAHMAAGAARRKIASVPVVPCSSAKWSRPIREEGIGGAWMVGRRVQVWCDSLNSWREGRVDAIDYLDSRVHCVVFVGAVELNSELVNLSKVRW